MLRKKRPIGKKLPAKVSEEQDGLIYSICFPTTGGMDKLTTALYNRLTAIPSNKHELVYGTVMA